MVRVFLYLTVFTLYSLKALAYDIRDKNGNLRKGSANIINTVPGQGEYIDSIHRFDEANIGLLNIASPKRFYGKDLSNCVGGKQVQEVLQKGKAEAIRQERSYYLMPSEKAFTIPEERIKAIASISNACAHGAVKALQTSIDDALFNLDRAKGIFEIYYLNFYQGAKILEVKGAQIDYSGCKGENLDKVKEPIPQYVQNSVFAFTEKYDALMAVLKKKRDVLTISKNQLITRGGSDCGPQ